MHIITITISGQPVQDHPVFTSQFRNYNHILSIIEINEDVSDLISYHHHFCTQQSYLLTL